MSPRERKLLFQLVEAALDADDDDVHCQLPIEDLKWLHDLGFLEKGGKSLSKAAFLEYFASFEMLSPLTEVTDHASALFSERIYWRKPIERMKKRMAPQHRGKSFPLLATVFIGRHADTCTWFHELGHLVYTRLTTDERNSFARCVHEHGSRLTSDGTQRCLDSRSGAETLLPTGTYLKIGSHLLGLDHSGTDEEAINDECWAAIFGLKFTNVPIPALVAESFDTIIERLYATSTPVLP